MIGPDGEKYPNWTVVYNIASAGSEWIGTGWEFFDSEEVAQARFEAIPAEAAPGYSGPVAATLRPFHGCDTRHLGASQFFWIESARRKPTGHDGLNQ